MSILHLILESFPPLTSPSIASPPEAASAVIYLHSLMEACTIFRLGINTKKLARRGGTFSPASSSGECEMDCGSCFQSIPEGVGTDLLGGMDS